MCCRLSVLIVLAFLLPRGCHTVRVRLPLCQGVSGYRRMVVVMDRPYYFAASQRDVIALSRAEGLSAPERQVLVWLCIYADHGDATVDLAASQLSDLTGLSERTVWRALKELTRLGYLEPPERKGGWRRK